MWPFCSHETKPKENYTDPWLLTLSDKIRELDIKIMGLEKHARKLQDTLDHYGIRMSNKVPDENKYYKRWKK